MNNEHPRKTEPGTTPLDDDGRDLTWDEADGLWGHIRLTKIDGAEAYWQWSEKVERN